MPLPVSLDTLLTLHKVESTRVEFKEAWNHVTIGSIVRTICAFANDLDNLGGGYVIIGIAEHNGVWQTPIKGLNVQELDTIEKEIVRYSHDISPSYLPKVSVETASNGAQVIVIWAPSGEDGPYTVHENVASANKTDKGQKRCYVRCASVTKQASDKDFKELVSLKARVPFDEQGNPHIKLSDISMTLLRDHLAKVGSRLADSDLRMDEQLENMQLIAGSSENKCIKNVAAMMFCEHPDKFFPCTRAEIVVFPEGRLKNPDNFVELPLITGSVPTIIAKTLDYFKTHVIKETIIKQKDRAESIRFFNYPYQAIEEAVVNAFYHRDYQVYEPVEIVIEPQRITILSHTGPDRSISDQVLKDALLVRSRKYKNRRLGEFLKELGLTEGRASGFPTIQAELAKNGSPKASIETDADRSFFLIDIPCRTADSPAFPHPSSRSLALLHHFFLRAIDLGKYSGRIPAENTLRHMLLVLLLAENPLSISTIRDALGDVKRTSIQRSIISPLLELGLLEMTIPSSPNSSKQQYIAAPSAIAFTSDIPSDPGEQNS